MRKLLKKYNLVYDFIIFGSSVKNKMEPRDLDIAAISQSADAALIGEIKTAIDKEIKGVHLQVISYEDFIKSKLPYYILSEGYSVKDCSFLPEKLKIERKVLYSFDLRGLTQVQKVMFNKGLKSILESRKAEKVGKGALLVSFKSSGEIEDFFKEWQRKIRKKEFFEI